MITLTCTSCKARLQMDDAFAGGVCRCMYCGTIQTVPAHLKRTGAGSTVRVSAGAARGFAQEPAPPVSSDDSSDAAPSSGLTGSGLISGRLRAASIAPARKQRLRILLILLGATGLGALVLTILWVTIT